MDHSGEILIQEEEKGAEGEFVVFSLSAVTVLELA